MYYHTDSCYSNQTTSLWFNVTNLVALATGFSSPITQIVRFSTYANGVLLLKFKRSLTALKGVLVKNTNCISITLCAWWNLTCRELFLTLTSNCGLDPTWFLFTLSGCLNLFHEITFQTGKQRSCVGHSLVCLTQMNEKKNFTWQQ